MTYTEPTYCADCKEPTSLCQCPVVVSRCCPNCSTLQARLSAWDISAYANHDPVSLVSALIVERDEYKARLAHEEGSFANYRAMAEGRLADVEHRRAFWERQCDDRERWLKEREARLAEVEADCRELHKMASDGCAAALVTSARLAECQTKAAALDQIKGWLDRGATIKAAKPGQPVLVAQADGTMRGGMTINLDAADSADAALAAGART